MVRGTELVGSSSQLIGSAVRLGRDRKCVDRSLSILVAADMVNVDGKRKMEKYVSNLADKVVFWRRGSGG